MKALIYNEHGGPEKLIKTEVPDPVIAADEVLVAVVATSVNRADLLQLRGRYPGYERTGSILGLDLSGTVIEVGSEVSDLEVGDPVCALVDGGGYAQLAAVPAAMCLKLPANMSFTKAAALPEVFTVAYQCFDWLAQLTAGQSVLIHAGASGVGTAMVQYAKQKGARVFVTASAPKHAQLYDLGAEVCIDYKSEEFDEIVMSHTGGKGVDVLVDFIGGPYSKQNINTIAVDGTGIMLSQMGGRYAEEYDMSPILMKRLTIVGSTLRNRSDEYKRKLTADLRTHAWPLFGEGKLFALVDTIFDWDDARSALEYMESNANVGKIVITIGD
ncbi:NAD(P)H-quinone oxidoreductase [Neolewinella antarctica]|uniref:PIG3 family NAD(P)H quinone oxidoreductase n=1 Tax=Neolewinella antarctica TaxID=442734 RepID=A0ABX0X6M8_9BACT|nr:NAD(P)H-quinone oxidoreductase [Neolewinella antarctica]NJC24651.1 putative PIG3 family NAD(P)H quinone oxidoreductase [Neolewinella antarctica]